jgi:hypothetical protein
MAGKRGIVGAVVVVGAVAFGIGAASGSAGITSPTTLTVFEHSTPTRSSTSGRMVIPPGTS